MLSLIRKALFPTLPVLLLSAVVAHAQQVPGAGSAGAATVAEVEGQKITADELDKSIATQLTQLQEQMYSLRRQRLDAMINERLLLNEATRQKLSTGELIDKEVTSKTSLVTETEIDAFYTQNKERLKDGPELRSQIRQYLQNQRLNTARDTYLASLRTKAGVAVNLPGPPAVRMEVAAGTLPVKGADSATVTIVKFEDFQCPFCRQAQATITQLEAKYGNKVKVVHRDFPIDQIHPLARRAAEGARCANEQGKFWAYHDKLYLTNLSPEPTQLAAVAKDTGLDADKFDKCLASGQYKDAVQKDVDEGRKLGITATPAFFINGRLLVGAQPLENFVRVVDDELALKTSSTTAR